MMSGHGANPIFFNKKIKIGRPEHSLTPHPPTFDNISFLPYPPTPPSKWMSYVYHPNLQFMQTILYKSLDRHMAHYNP